MIMAPPPAHAAYACAVFMYITVCIQHRSMPAGTYGPALKLIYAEEHPLDPATLTAVRGFIAAAALLGVDALSHYWQQTRHHGAVRDGEGMEYSRRIDKYTDQGTVQLERPVVSQDLLQGTVQSERPVVSQDLLSSEGSSSLPSIPSIPTLSLPPAHHVVWGSLAIAGLELGLYNFTATSMEAVGLQATSATRAGFISQSCAVITPALAHFMVREGTGRCMSCEESSSDVPLTVK